MKDEPELHKAIKALMDKAILEMRGRMLLAEYEYWERECDFLAGKISVEEYFNAVL